MSAARIDRRTLSRAKPADLLRLAKFVGVNVPDNCICIDCNIKLMEGLVRKLDNQNNKYSYEEIIKRLEDKYK